jgi:hypothetical protein
MKTQTSGGAKPALAKKPTVAADTVPAGNLPKTCGKKKSHRPPRAWIAVDQNARLAAEIDAGQILN